MRLKRPGAEVWLPAAGGRGRRALGIRVHWGRRVLWGREGGSCVTARGASPVPPAVTCGPGGAGPGPTGFALATWTASAESPRRSAKKGVPAAVLGAWTGRGSRGHS